MKKLLLAALVAVLPITVNAAPLQKYQSGFRTIDGDQLNKMVNVVNALTGNSGTPSTGYFSANTGTGPTPLTGTVLQVVGANTATARIELDSYAGVPIFSSVRRNGTKASPTAILSADQLGSYNFQGASSTTATYGPASRVTSYATENWSGTAGGTKLVLSTTPNTTQTLTDIVTIDQNGATSVTSAASTALAVGRLGATTPALQVDASTATSITGLKIKSAAAAGGLALSAVGEASNGNMTIDAQGSGTLTFNSIATGNIVMGAAVTGVSNSVTGGYTAKSGTAVPASAGAIAAGAPITMFSTGIKIWVTSDTPAFSATKGDIAINTGGSSTSTRLFINNGTTNWIAITTAS